MPSGQGKRCLHYVPNGTCALPDGFMCVEWLKRNAPPQGHVRSLPVLVASEPRLGGHDQPQVERDLFGNAVSPSASSTKSPVPSLAPVKPAVTPVPSIEVSDLPGMTAQDIQSYRELGLEVRFRAEACGDVWLVPAYTGQPRQEITPEHAALILRVLSVFPGSLLVAFERSAKPAPSTSKEVRT